MNLKHYIFISFIFFFTVSFAQPKIKLDTFARGFSAPIDIANDGFTSRVFVAQQNGIIWALDSNGIKLDTFIDIRTRVQSSGEEGLLGFAFHPDFQHNGYFYTYYTIKNTTNNNVVRYKITSNPNRATIDSEKVIITFSHPGQTNHNGGCIKFGSDGYLYIGVGDGGSSGDPNGNGQNKNTLLGKLLRLDVNNFSTSYTVPSTNPFVGQSNVKTEIWAYGLRNPWRFSFDRQTNDLWIGDVGQGSREEVDFQATNSTGGENYGWRCYEGNSTYNTSGCGNASNYKFPVFEYDHSANGGVAITGGYVYRGSKYNDFKGYYICADYTSTNFWAIRKDGNTFTNYFLGKPLAGLYLSSFGQDIRGELYATNIVNGVIYKIRELCSSLQLNLVNKKNPSCPNISNGSIEMTSVGNNGAVTYNWSNSGSGNLISNLAPDKYVVTATDAIGCVRKDSFTLVNQDTLRLNLISKQNPSCPNVSNGQISVQVLDGFGPITYNWNNGGSSATISNLAPNKYIVTATDTVGCSAKDSATLYNADTLDKPTIIMSGDTLFTSIGFTYQWKSDDTDITGANQSFYKVIHTGHYQIEITDVNGCKALSDIFSILTSVKNKNSDIQQFFIFPNPAKDNLTLDIKSKTNNFTTLRITNSIGQLLYEDHYSGKIISENISLKKLPAGTYYLSIELSDGSTETRTFVKE